MLTVTKIAGLVAICGLKGHMRTHGTGTDKTGCTPQGLFTGH